MAIIERELDNCKAKLLEAKSDVLNRVRSARDEIVNEDRGGDEGDQTMRALQESDFLRMNERLRKQLAKIEMALARIENGTYGICEETEEPIEKRTIIGNSLDSIEHRRCRN